MERITGYINQINEIYENEEYGVQFGIHEIFNHQSFDALAVRDGDPCLHFSFVSFQGSHSASLYLSIPCICNCRNEVQLSQANVTYLSSRAIFLTADFFKKKGFFP